IKKNHTCVGDAQSRRVSYSTESFLQPVHKPYITMCQNHRLCSTYKTIYRVSYRQVSRAAPNSHIYPECCPGWRRMHSHNCNQAVCEQSCANGGSCLRPNHCACPRGWTGRYCQTDVDECKEGHRCSQKCVNTVGSYRCVCQDGFSLAEDEITCSRIPAPSSLPSGAPKADDRSSRSHCQRCVIVGKCGLLYCSISVCFPSSAPCRWSPDQPHGSLLLLVRAMPLSTRTVSNSAL
uniref:EGF-like-domain, multiple 7 n=1 Tax=Cyprinus carpio TaxID=7962 RepID=A0A8C1MMI7_CYPCA